ncbi:fungal-specific transcription factor domain-containing protein [Trichoderma novae-zelandiae]
MSRSTETCWTCRIRKKRCDRKQPACGACHSLDITCYAGNSRPSWADDELEREKFADQIKAQVKEKAERRREKSYVKVLPLGRVSKPKDASIAAAHRPSKRQKSSLPLEATKQIPIVPVCQGCAEKGTLSPGECNQSQTRSPNPGLLGIFEDIDIDLEIIFLDYAFPFLFPFYRPSLFKGGRGWLLATLRKSMPLFHTAMGFSTYFFTLAMTDIAKEGHDTCRAIVEGKLTSHVDTAIKAMRKGVEELANAQKPPSVFERAHLMEGVVQLLVFETNIAGSTEWGIHLNAAVSLFKEIFEMQNTQEGRADLDSVLAMMQRSGWSTVTANHRIWNPDQGAFLFHVAFLVFADIISATIRGRSPMLRDYYPLLDIGKLNAENRRRHLDLEDFVGCQGWILLLIAGIVALVEGKKQGRVSRNDLLIEGNRIAEALQEGMANLRANLEKPASTDTCFFQAYSNPEALPQAHETTSYSLIWAHATVLYLFVTTSGWQDKHSIVQENASSAFQLLGEISSPAVLRSLAWPFCVIGCLASADQEETFRRIASRMGPLSAFGTLYEALRIMQQVWSTRGERDVENWDFSNCFRILGSMPLLI